MQLVVYDEIKSVDIVECAFIGALLRG